MIPQNGRVFIDMLEYARPQPITPDLLEWTDVLSNYIDTVLVSAEMDAAEAMRRAAEEINPILQRSQGRP